MKYNGLISLFHSTVWHSLNKKPWSDHRLMFLPVSYMDIFFVMLPLCDHLQDFLKSKNKSDISFQNLFITAIPVLHSLHAVRSHLTTIYSTNIEHWLPVYCGCVHVLVQASFVTTKTVKYR